MDFDPFGFDPFGLAVVWLDGLDRHSGHLDRSQRKSRRKWLSPWGEMPRLMLSDQGIDRNDGQGRLDEMVSSGPHARPDEIAHSIEPFPFFYLL